MSVINNRSRNKQWIELKCMLLFVLNIKLVNYILKYQTEMCLLLGRDLIDFCTKVQEYIFTVIKLTDSLFFHWSSSHSNLIISTLNYYIKLKNSSQIFTIQTYLCLWKLQGAWKTLIDQHLVTGYIYPLSSSYF